MLSQLARGELRTETLFGGELFQIGYVTTELTTAMKVMQDRYGIGEFKVLHHNDPSGFQTAAALAWAGETMIEVIEAQGAGTSFYTDRLPSSGFAIRQHHFGYLLPSVEHWESVHNEAVRQELPIPIAGANDSFRAAYVEAPELGHFLEYIYPLEKGLEFFNSVPGSRVQLASGQ